MLTLARAIAGRAYAWFTIIRAIIGHQAVIVFVVFVFVHGFILQK
jgi:hypothetical protein